MKSGSDHACWWGVTDDKPLDSDFIVSGLGSSSYITYFSNSEPSVNIMTSTYSAPEPGNVRAKRTEMCSL